MEVTLGRGVTGWGETSDKQDEAKNTDGMNAAASELEVNESEEHGTDAPDLFLFSSE
jgi:hypothetical protein